MVRQRRRRRQQRQDLLQCTNGTRIKYLFKDKPKAWYKGTVIRVHNSGVNKGMAHVKFDDGDTYFNLPVSADDIAQSGGKQDGDRERRGANGCCAGQRTATSPLCKAEEGDCSVHRAAHWPVVVRRPVGCVVLKRPVGCVVF